MTFHEAQLGAATAPASGTRVVRARHGERGGVILFVAVMLLVLVGFAGFAFDSAWSRTTSLQLQWAADGSALAAARLVMTDSPPFNLARQVAIDIALINSAGGDPVQLEANTSNDPAGDIVIGRWNETNGTFTATHVNPNAVRVRARRSATSAGGALDLFFGDAFGVPDIDVEAQATSLATTSDLLVFVLNPTVANALELSGGPSMDVTAGKVQVNSSANCATLLSNNSFLSTQQLRVKGTACYPPGGIVGAIQEGATPAADPIADLLPDTAAWNAFKASLTVQPGSNGKGRIGASGSYPPGYYDEGVSIKGGDVVTLQPGLFMFGPSKGNGIKLTGGAKLTANDVTLFVDRGVSVDVTGTNTDFSVTASTTGAYQGIATFHHRDGDLGSPGQHDVKLASGGLVYFEGLMYVPNGDVWLGGSSNQTYGAILSRECYVSGGVGYLITGEGIPDEMKSGVYVYLVE